MIAYTTDIDRIRQFVAGTVLLAYAYKVMIETYGTVLEPHDWPVRPGRAGRLEATVALAAIATRAAANAATVAAATANHHRDRRRCRR